MNRRNDMLRGSAAAVGMALLILDSKTALAGAQSGMELCIRTVIPSLFPFFLLSILLTTAMMGRRIPLLKPLCRLCRIPEGAGPLLLAGLVGGYPVGAQCVSQAYESGALDGQDVRRMLAFCNNCGPAFLFGMAAGLFEQWWAPWALWGIHIVSALCVGALIPGNASRCRAQPSESLTVVQALNRALRIMAGVCGWVVIFRVVIEFLQRWALWWLPAQWQAAVCGILELSNGCIALYEIENTGLRFLLCAGFLGFGGLCVTMQTFSVTKSGLDRSLYFPGKVLQCCISLLLASMVQIGFRNHFYIRAGFVIPVGIGLMAAVFLRKKQNSSGIPAPVGV